MTDYTPLFSFEGGEINIIATFKGQRVVGKGNSQFMVAASPVWRKFIFPPWLPQSPSLQSDSEDITNDVSGLNVVKQIDCRDDDGFALLILLRIAHLKFDEVPNTLPVNTMFNLALLCEQYLCTNLVKPWLTKWFVDAPKRSVTGWPEPWLYSAYTFGSVAGLEQVARRITVEATLPSGGELTVFKDKQRKTCREIQEPLPSGLLDYQRASKKYDKKQSKHSLQSLIGTLTNSVELNSDHVHGSLQCKTVGGDIETLSYAIANLGNKIWTNIAEVHYLEDKYGGGECFHHEACFKGTYDKEVKYIMENIRSPVLASHRRHMTPRKEDMAFDPKDDPLLSLTETDP
ncbi:hypothetical protein BDZ45DRAFT_774059 [Acephala macrosclerotiorum]|nr:hypothetical protein BDZ45DRAFT_774059 [Acephala macrosclerotiorum]